VSRRERRPPGRQGLAQVARELVEEGRTTTSDGRAGYNYHFRRREEGERRGTVFFISQHSQLRKTQQQEEQASVCTQQPTRRRVGGIGRSMGTGRS